MRSLTRNLSTVNQSKYLPMNEYQLIRNKLQTLGMDWNHPRIVAFLDDCRNRYQSNFPVIKMPKKVASRLLEFLTLYEQVRQQLKARGLEWTDEVISSFFMQYSVKVNGENTNRLTLEKWEELKAFCSERVIPF